LSSRLSFKKIENFQTTLFLKLLFLALTLKWFLRKNIKKKVGPNIALFDFVSIYIIFNLILCK